MFEALALFQFSNACVTASRALASVMLGSMKYLTVVPFCHPAPCMFGEPFAAHCPKATLCEMKVNVKTKASAERSRVRFLFLT